MYDVTSCLAAWFHVLSGGLCHWSHVPSGGLCPGGLCRGRGLCRETPRMRKVVGMHPIGMLSCLIIIKAFSCDRRQEDWVKSGLSA